ncbi:hypothetical protein ACFSC6_01780 [Rufibacter sediminis]|uniref:Lipoprotein n=1 Tax=Rufibacter sediminis TaxID=2762756 RepID=A0ABR6VWU8_9BACT|nr:hypothetical protein [Rufibacter sediminis]MBC3541699.1 hypothetical protein [Rufibacter sediminis]
MKKTSTLLGTSLALVLFLGSCASSYRPIRPQTVHYDYNEISATGALSTSFAFDVMTLRNNKKYAKKETKNNMKVVSMKVVNNTDAPIHVGRDCRLFMGGREIIPMEPTVAANKIKQGVPIYLLYALLFLNITQENTSGSYVTESSSTSLPIGLPIAAGNMLVAGNANKKMKEEIIGNNILNKTINPGETAYGVICLNESTTGRLKFELNQAQ